MLTAAGYQIARPTARGRNVMNLFTYLRARIGMEEGQDLLEYALLVALIAIVAVVAVEATGTSVFNIFDAIATDLEDALTP